MFNWLTENDSLGVVNTRSQCSVTEAQRQEGLQGGGQPGLPSEFGTGWGL